MTSLGGLPLFLRAVRNLDVPGSVKRHLRLKQRERGLDEAAYVESFLTLNAVGGDCLEDFDPLREASDVTQMTGYQMPSAEGARKFLNRFHCEALIEQAQRELPAGRVSYIPQESAGLRALAQVNADVVRELGRRCEDQKIATVDLDATIIESWKKQAKMTYEGVSGYQPMLALWAEMNVVLGDEFRDGNVPAQQDPLRVAQRAFAALPETVGEYYFRGDSACEEEGLLTWLRNQQRPDGPQGFIGFAVSARMNAALKEEILAVPESRWQLYGEDSGMCARRHTGQFWRAPADTLTGTTASGRCGNPGGRRSCGLPSGGGRRWITREHSRWDICGGCSRPGLSGNWRRTRR